MIDHESPTVNQGRSTAQISILFSTATDACYLDICTLYTSLLNGDIYPFPFRLFVRILESDRFSPVLSSSYSQMFSNHQQMEKKIVPTYYRSWLL